MHARQTQHSIFVTRVHLPDGRVPATTRPFNAEKRFQGEEQGRTTAAAAAALFRPGTYAPDGRCCSHLSPTLGCCRQTFPPPPPRGSLQRHHGCTGKSRDVRRQKQGCAKGSGVGRKPLLTMVTTVGLPITRSACAECYNNTSRERGFSTRGSTPETDVSHATMMPL